MPTSILFLCFFNISVGAPADYDKLKAQAEARFAEGSFELANELYQQAKALSLSTSDRQWVEFRLADTTWRSQAGSQTHDSSRYEEAYKSLSALYAALEKDQGKSRLWVEVVESLGDYMWMRPDSHSWWSAWELYQRALDYWAGTSGDEARTRYLKIVLRAVEPAWRDSSYYYGYYSNTLPIAVAEKAVKLSRTDEEKAVTYYILARALRDQSSSYEQRARVSEAYEAVLKLGRRFAWYDDALYEYAYSLETVGRISKPMLGDWKADVDYVKAVELYRRLRAELKQSETRYWNDAQQRIDEITRPILGLQVSNIFLPESELQFSLNWRNLKKIDLGIYAVDLSTDLQQDELKHTGSWLESLDLAKAKRVQGWTKDTSDRGDYKPGSEIVRVQGKLALGAYVIEASAGTLKTRDFILVSDAALVLKTSGRQALAYFCNALDGSPIAKARVSLWYRDEDRDGANWIHGTAQTSADGLANFSLERNVSSANIFVAANRDNRQALSTGYSYRQNDSGKAWRVYAYTDRPAYRPKETVQWKLIAREFNGRDYTTPAGQTLVWEVYDARGSKVGEGKTKLNAFGSAWGSLPLTEGMVLGEYRLQLYTEGRANNVGSATLFRLEEYKLPEFLVSVKIPETNGKPSAFKAGDKVEADVVVEYYFGGGVPNADVDVVVRQKPFWPSYSRERDFPWLYNENGGYGYYSGWGGYDLLHQSLKTDASGKAKVTFTVPQLGDQNTEFAISAKVVDSSRREVTGSGRVRISSRPYFIYANARHAVYAPKEKVSIDFKALDANDAPAEVEGTVTVTRETWTEVWLDPKGKEIAGATLKKLQQTAFPPTDGWKAKSFGFLTTEVAKRPAKTNAQGNLVFEMMAGDEGFYRVRWQGIDTKTPVTTEAAIYVATQGSQDLGYHGGGLEIILDREDGRLGDTVRALIYTPTPNHWVLFSAEATDIYDYELVELSGNTRLVELKIDARHAPNVFLVATLVDGRQVQQTMKELVVPPLKQYLEVEIKTNGTTFEPRAKTKVEISTHDAAGKPVAAEVSLGLVDESVYAIQAEYAGDPRQAFWGDKRSFNIQLSSTFNLKSYVRLVKGDKGELVDAQYVEEQRRQRAVLQAPVSGTEIDEEALAPESQADDREMKAPSGAVSPILSESAASGAAAPASAPSMRAEAKDMAPSRAGGKMKRDAGGGEGRGGGQPTLQVRSDFRATAFWKPDIVTNENGRATIEVQFPDSLTSWKGTARAVGRLTQLGIGTTKVRTQQPLMVRLQGPRFFVVGDKLTLSAIVNNYSDKTEEVAVDLEAEGLTIEGVYSGLQTSRNSSKKLTLSAGGEARVDWRVAVQQAGDVRLKVTAAGAAHGDAMEKKFRAYEHGIDKMLAKAGKLRDAEAKVTLDLPPRRQGSTRMTVQVTPSLATTILDALPYLIAYPYGCTEQTMSRFLPTVIVRRAMKQVGLDPQEAMSRLAANLREHPAGQKAPVAKGNVDEIDKMVDAGLKRLYDFQHSDGGWGWWKDDSSDRFMTAYVLWGLSLAREAGVDIKSGVVEHGAGYLRNVIVEDELDLNRQAWTLQALSAVHAATSPRANPSDSEAVAIENLWKHRDSLNAYGRALFTLALKSFDMPDRARILVQNLENGAAWDKATDSSLLIKGARPRADAPTLGIVHWGADGAWWHWHDSPIETTAFALKALIAVDHEHRLIDPAMNWLLKNRRGAEWTNTRDTSVALLALTDYLAASGETTQPLEFEVLVNGKLLAKHKVLKKEVFRSPSTFDVDPTWLKDGQNEIVIKKLKGNALYFFARADFFSLEEPVSAAGHEIFVKRQYFKLGSADSGEAIAAKQKTPLEDNGSIKSGERVEVVLTVEAKNDYEYLVFEDLKPAGFEAVEVKSGEPLYALELKSAAAQAKHGVTAPGTDKAAIATPYSNGETTGRTAWVYQELRDRKVAMFVGKLPQGVWEIHYLLRAEVPGKFHGLPVLGHAMYVPEVRANSDETRVEVKERD